MEGLSGAGEEVLGTWLAAGFISSPRRADWLCHVVPLLLHIRYQQRWPMALDSTSDNHLTPHPSHLSRFRS